MRYKFHSIHFPPSAPAPSFPSPEGRKRKVFLLLGLLLIFSPSWLLAAEKTKTPIVDKSATRIILPPPPKTISAPASSKSKKTKQQAPAKQPALMPNRSIIVVIDPGHGGKDPGACGPGGNKEKNVVLAIARQVQQLLNQDRRFRAQLTRNTDIYIPLRQRLAIARRYKPDLFIAVHADAAFNNNAVGASVFALSERGATSEMARWLAKKENQSEVFEGVFVQKDPMLRSVLLDLSQSHTISVSLDMGKVILRRLSEITHLHYARVEQAAFVVLKSPDIPSLLVETGYLTNPRQERQLVSPAYQRQLALAIVQGIKDYFLRNQTT